MKILRKFLTHKTKETVFKFEIARLFILITLGTSLTIIDIRFIKLLSLRLILTLIFCLIYYSFILSIYRLIGIFDNKDKLKRTLNIKKCKWKPYKVEFNELLNIINKINVSISFETLIRNVVCEFGVVVDVDSKKKHFYLNEFELETLVEFRNLILKYLPFSDTVILYSVDKYNPEENWEKLIQVVKKK